MPESPEAAYNHFYSAMRGWGRYELVSTPGEADLVLELRFTAPMYMNGALAVFEPQFGLNILDAKTHFLLLESSSAGGRRVPGKNLAQEFRSWTGHAWMDDLRNMTAGPVASPAPVKK